MKKRIIWSNMDLNIDDWRDGYAEFCDINNITPGDDGDIYDWMIDTNFNYLDDEIINLNARTDGVILCIADVGRWNGRVNACTVLNNNINSIFNIADAYTEYYGDGHEIRATGSHHDGTNYYIFRAARPGRDLDKLFTAIYNGEKISAQKLNYYTRSIYADVAKIYGWKD